MTSDPPPHKRGRSEPVAHDANEVLEFLFDAGTSLPEEGYNPDMSHQVFGEDETILGHPDPSITVTFSPAFHSLLEFDSGGTPDPGATDVPSALRGALGDGMFLQPDAFVQAVQEEGPLDLATLGTPVAVPEIWDGGKGGGAGAVQVLHSRIADASPQLKALHARLQPLLLFFIDAASMVDQADPDWDLLLAMVDTPGGPRVAGFATLYNFFGWPDSKRVRVSQVLVLPPFQKRGVGAALLAAAAAHAAAAGVVDVTYEDPTEDLQRLRDRLDARRAGAEPWFLDAAREAAAVLAGPGKGAAGECKEAGVSPALALHARTALGLCKQQAQRVWEVLVYESLLVRVGGKAAGDLIQGAIRHRLGAAIAAAEAGSQGKAMRDTEAGFVMHRRGRGRAESARAAPTVPVEEGTAESKAAAVDRAVEARVDAIAAVAQRPLAVPA